LPAWCKKDLLTAQHLGIIINNKPHPRFGTQLAKFMAIKTLERGKVMRGLEAIKSLVRDDRGISAVEYALLLALIGAGIAAAAFLLGGQVQNNINNATQSLQGGGS